MHIVKYAPRKIAIAADSLHTIETGKWIAEQGGNAADVAVGAAITATLAEVLMTSFGGSAFFNNMDQHGKLAVIEGADMMPSIPRHKIPKSLEKAYIDYGDGIEVNTSYQSIAVPGFLKAAETTWKNFGRLPWEVITAPAIDLAKQGVTANRTLEKWLKLAGKAIFFKQEASRRCFFPKADTPLKEGDIFTLPGYAETLEQIQRGGAKDFYEGDLAHKISSHIISNGGFVRREDLASYQVSIRKPLTLNSMGYQLSLNPPPAIGGAILGSMILMANELYRPELSQSDRHLAIANFQRAALSIRGGEIKHPLNHMAASSFLQKDWIKHNYSKLMSPNTAHISAVDENGAACAATMSNGYGSGVTIPGTGIPMNNSLGEPELNPGGFYELIGGSRLASNMSPTIAWKRDGDIIAIGSPGASRITTALLQGWIGITFHGLSLQDAVDSPRLHTQDRDGTFIAQCEPGIDTRKIASHYDLEQFNKKDMYFGALSVVRRTPQGNLEAAADSRRNGVYFV